MVLLLLQEKCFFLLFSGSGGNDSFGFLDR